jgi:HD-GYP domain-containing protein (c-di-GMP phosphodiesterase class II)
MATANDDTEAAVGKAGIDAEDHHPDGILRAGPDAFPADRRDPRGGRPSVQRLNADRRGTDDAIVFLWGDNHELRRALGEANARVAGLEARLKTVEHLLAAAPVGLDHARTDGGARAATRPAATDVEHEMSHAHVIDALAAALAERDRYTGEHSATVVELAETVATALGLEEVEVERIGHAARLHDVGKVGVPDRILHKAAPLGGEEWELMREHPLIGERIVRAIPGMGSVARIVRHEHERVDGSGYPDGLAGDAIPVGSRIILACDAYHAMTSDRPYRGAMAHQEAIAELASCAGTQFDPEVVSALVSCLGRGARFTTAR